MATTTQAIVAYTPSEPGKPNLKLEELSFRELREDEVLVKMIASGICHTDILVGSAPEGYMNYPKVLGHEGAGIVEKVGDAVTTVEPGNRVLLSFVSCTTCHTCTSGHPAYCTSLNLQNIPGDASIFRLDSTSVAGSFFGHSSFAALSIVKDRSIVNVTDLVREGDEMKLFAPMGCGFQTGAATVSKLAKARKDDSVVVMGLGGVGLSAIMAAKIQGCHTIVGIDRIAGRLDLAGELGATHAIDTSDASVGLSAEIKSITKNIGATIVIDTTGNVELIGKGLDFTANLGHFFLLGVPPRYGKLEIDLSSYLTTGKSFRASVQGDAVPSEYIPQMIKWYREGQFPVEKLVKFYPAKDFQLAINDMHSGAIVKPVLLW